MVARGQDNPTLNQGQRSWIPWAARKKHQARNAPTSCEPPSRKQPLDHEQTTSRATAACPLAKSSLYAGQTKPLRHNPGDRKQRPAGTWQRTLAGGTVWCASFGAPGLLFCCSLSAPAFCFFPSTPFAHASLRLQKIKWAKGCIIQPACPWKRARPRITTTKGQRSRRKVYVQTRVNNYFCTYEYLHVHI